MATALEEAMAHHAPEAGTTPNLEHSHRRLGYQGGRADRSTKDLDEKQGPQTLAVELGEV